ncbi:hypothetical protein FDA94_02775 [Herbidospora galbida]|uniref:Uncharacterized protein n=1 Tax=Herbidospora galbida TaxID=2575442 RepID=A0A4V5V0B3_9ACTN|nr:hypothetical protein [Herbidospora galbida]TKK91713.1 hypothetical protein FDA94_02775 [Herbidospora galbida]
MAHQVDGREQLVLTFRPEGLPSYRALIRAARAGEVAFSGRPEQLDAFLRVFTLREPARRPAG